MTVQIISIETARSLGLNKPSVGGSLSKLLKAERQRKLFDARLYCSRKRLSFGQNHFLL